MRNYKLESGIPIPPIVRKPRGIASLLRQMRRGQSIRLPKVKLNTAQVAAARILGRGKFTVRSNGSHFRIWRTG